MYVINSAALRDVDFLKQLDTYPQREVIAKVITLDLDENPIAEITGKMQTGNISIDGTSSCRRTCTLTLFTTDSNVNELDWQIHTKYVISIGMRNFVDTEKYPEWIWFPLGTYVATSINLTNSVNNGFLLSLTGKDKMCLIDGTVGGQLFATHDFGRKEIISRLDGSLTREPIDIKTIIREAIHVYAKEPYANIIINDLDDVAVELLDYKVSNKDCFIYDCGDAVNTWYDESTNTTSITDYNGKYDTDMTFEGTNIYTWLSNKYTPGIEGTIFSLKYHNKYIRIVKKLEYGDTAGYRRTDLTYPSEDGSLIINAGGTIGDLLKKITEAFGEFEYFYDVYGRFIFQRKRIYHNVVWNNTVPDEESSVGYYTSSESSQTIYDFTNGLIIESYNNKPNMDNIKNDWAVWGKITTGEKDSKYPCHLRYAIDDKPIAYHCLTNDVWYCTEGYQLGQDRTTDDYTEYVELREEYRDYITAYITNDTERVERLINDNFEAKLDQHTKVVDWREIIYRMAIDYENAKSRIEELLAIQDRYVVGIVNGLFVDDPSTVLDVHGQNTSYYYDTTTHKLKLLSYEEFQEINDKRLENQLPAFTWEEYVRNQNKTVFFHIPILRQDGSYSTPEDTLLQAYTFTDSAPSGGYAEGWLNYFGIRGSFFAGYGKAKNPVTGELNNYYSPAMYVTKNSMNNVINKLIKQWEKRLDNRYAIYFADILGFWNLYYKTENNLTYDDVPSYLQSSLTSEAQAVVSISSIGVTAAQTAFENSMKAIEREVDITADEREGKISMAYTNYANKLNELSVKLANYSTKLRILVTNPSTELESIFTTASTYLRDQQSSAARHDSVVTLKARYDVYQSTIQSLSSTFDTSQVTRKANLVSDTYALWEANNHWNPNIIKCDLDTAYLIKFIAPENMLYWFDFMDAGSALGRYKVSVIGHRAKTINDDKIKAIFFRDTPNVLWISPEDELYEDIDNLSYVRLRLNQGLENYFKTSTQGKSAKETLDTLLYETTHYNETITINCLPIYYLEPNHRIRVVDNDSGIRGEYIIKSYNVQLQYDGMMSITAYKAADRII